MTPRPPAGAPSSKQTVIKRYANRRLYNSLTGKYVSRKSLEEMARRGEEFVVEDTIKPNEAVAVISYDEKPGLTFMQLKLQAHSSFQQVAGGRGLLASPRHRRPGERTHVPPGLHSQKPQQGVCAAWKLRREPGQFSRCRRFRIHLHERADPGAGPDQPTGRGSDGAQFRALEAIRAQAPSPDEEDFGAGGGGARIIEGNRRSGH